MVFETVGLVWGYVFVIVIAGCSLIIGYYKGKGLIKFPLGSSKKESESTEEQKSSTETEWGVPPKNDDNGEKKN